MGYYAAHPALGVFHIAPVPWDHVDVDVRHRLARCLTNIDTDVVAIRVEVPVDDPVPVRRPLPMASAVADPIEIP